MTLKQNRPLKKSYKRPPPSLYQSQYQPEKKVQRRNFKSWRYSWWNIACNMSSGQDEILRREASSARGSLRRFAEKLLWLNTRFRIPLYATIHDRNTGVVLVFTSTIFHMTLYELLANPRRRSLHLGLLHKLQRYRQKESETFRGCYHLIIPLSRWRGWSVS